MNPLCLMLLVVKFPMTCTLLSELLSREPTFETCPWPLTNMVCTCPPVCEPHVYRIVATMVRMVESP